MHYCTTRNRDSEPLAAVSCRVGNARGSATCRSASFPRPRLFATLIARRLQAALCDVPPSPARTGVAPHSRPRRSLREVGVFLSTGVHTGHPGTYAHIVVPELPAEVHKLRVLHRGSLASSLHRSSCAQGPEALLTVIAQMAVSAGRETIGGRLRYVQASTTGAGWWSLRGCPHWLAGLHYEGGRC